MVVYRTSRLFIKNWSKCVVLDIANKCAAWSFLERTFFSRRILQVTLYCFKITQYYLIKSIFISDILPELITIACIYVILVILSFYIAIQLRARRLLHVSYKIFIASLLCQLVGILFEIYSYINLGLRGIPTQNAYLLGQLLEACSDILYTVLMLLLALGFTVTKSVLTARQTRWLICFICLISFCQFSLYIYQSDVFDPGLVLYIYESPPGYGLIILKLIAWIIFSLRCFKTVRKMSTKLHFYGSLFSLGSAWFLCHPLTVYKKLCI